MLYVTKYIYIFDSFIERDPGKAEIRECEVKKLRMTLLLALLSAPELSNIAG